MHHVVAQSRVFKITPVHFFGKLEIRNYLIDDVLIEYGGLSHVLPLTVYLIL